MSRTPTTGPTSEAPHRPADDKEEVYFSGSPLLRAELGTVTVCLIIALAILAGVFFTATSELWWLWIVGGVLAIGVVMIPFILTKTVHYRISNYRVDFERGLFSKRIDTLELWHVEDISFYQSFLDRILRTGRITIITHDDTTPKLEMHGLPDPRPVFDALKQRIISVKRQRGVIKIDGGHDFPTDAIN